MNENVFKRNELLAQKVIKGLASRNKDRISVILVNDDLGF